ncbi:CRISPR-associated helicase Cas3' [Streptomyces sp. NPDC085946]|uniref:CRISPR-associated helicase Cas3' n=1 Tax=Streptomyces sp. NPDC085946 TaxID=3365744 RepID=UPI0037D4F5CC
MVSRFEQLLRAVVLAWGKTDQSGDSARRGGPAWTPLLAHLLDVAATAGVLWDRHLPPHIRRRLTEAFGAGNEATARQVVMLLAALHDLGKASDCFLGQWQHGRGNLQSKLLAKAWEEQARTAGLPLGDDLAHAFYARHEHVTAVVLPRLLGCPCPECGGTGERHEGLHDAGVLLGGHHGHIPNPETVERARGAAPAAQWGDIHAAIVQTVADAVGLDLGTVAQVVDPVRPSARVAFLYLVYLADWVASDTEFFRFRVHTAPVTNWWQAALQEADQAVRARRLARWQARPMTWAEMWPDTPLPRTFQADGMQLAPAEGQAMIVVESDTGSGKTRLALWMAHHLARTCGYSGLYMALPTRAAGNQVAKELRKFLHAVLAPGEVRDMALVHGTAQATDLVHQLVDAHQAHGDALTDLSSAVEAATCTDSSGLAVLDPWYLRRCLALVAGFGVGTVDQIALAPQGSRHWALRLGALMCKVVIIDEAHAYELFQQNLLSAAVEWLAEGGASLVVLSATLPRSIRDELTTAWRRGLGVTGDDDTSQGPITVVDHHGRLRRGGSLPENPETPKLLTDIQLRKDSGDRNLVAELLDRARNGGCVVVRSTRVDPCRSRYREALQLARASGWQPEEILILHGMLLPRHRLLLETRLADILGPSPEGKRNPNRPKRLLVFATGVIEQSLDLDFDHGVTDLCPIDVALQFRGRIHRHTANNPHRPSWCRTASLTMLWQPGPDGLPIVEPPDFDAGRPTGTYDGLVYAPYVLAASWHILTQRRDRDGTVRLETPRDSAWALESVYGDPIQAPGAVQGLLDRTRAAYLDTLADEAHQAEARIFRPYTRRRRTPVATYDLASGYDQGDGDSGGVTGIAAVSRLGEESVDCLILYQQSDGTITYDHEGLLKADLGQRSPGRDVIAYRRQQKDFLANTLAIPARWFNGRRSLPPTTDWPKYPQPALRNKHVILVAPDSTCLSGPVGRLRYDHTTGIERM